MLVAALAGTLLVALAGWLALLGWTAVGTLNPPLFLLANLVLFTDCFDFLLRLYFFQQHTLCKVTREVSPTSVPLHVGSFEPAEMKRRLRPYAVLVSVHNPSPRELQGFLEGMRPYRDRLWVIDDASTDDTWERLQRARIQAVRASRNRHKPGALRELLAILPPEIETIVVLDPDARILDGGGPISDLERVLFDFQCSGMAAMCPRLVLREGTWLERLQGFEYGMSFGLGRRSLADHCITSGLSVYRRDALASTLSRHTLSIYAEDLKNACLLLSQGERIYYDGRLVIETEGKRTWRGWFSQRVGWFYGLMKVYCEHAGDAIRGAARRGAEGRFAYLYHFVVYMGLFLLVLHPLRVASAVLLALSAANGLDWLAGLHCIPDVPATDPAYFPLVYVKYLGLCTVAMMVTAVSRQRWRLLTVIPVYFLYVLAQVVPITVGYLNWFTLRLLGRRLYRDHFQAEESVRRELLEGRAR